MRRGDTSPGTSGTDGSPRAEPGPGPCVQEGWGAASPSPSQDPGGVAAGLGRFLSEFQGCTQNLAGPTRWAPACKARGTWSPFCPKRWKCLVDPKTRWPIVPKPTSRAR